MSALLLNQKPCRAFRLPSPPAPTTGKQYIPISAGGARPSPDRGDDVIAYALDK